MINELGYIDVPVGKCFSDGDNTYIAIMPHACSICAFRYSRFKKIPCRYLACCDWERSDDRGVHFIKEGGENEART